MDSFSKTKSNIENLVLTMALLPNKDSNNTSFEIVTPFCSIQLYTNNNSSEQEMKDIENNLTTLNISSCEDFIRKKYNLSKNLFIAKVGYSEILNNASTLLDSNNTNIISAGSSVNFRMFNPDTKMEYNISQECNDIEMSIKIPLPKYNRINPVQSMTFTQMGIDINNQNDSFYVDRCKNYPPKNNDNIQLTIRERKTSFYKNQTISCSAGCLFKGIDDNKYMICECINTENVSSNVLGEAAIALSSINYEIALCSNILNEAVHNFFNF